MSDAAKIIPLNQSKYPRRRHGQCHRCERVDYLPWSTEHGVMYCGHCWEADAIAYVFGMTADPVSTPKDSQ